jgi:hypothetical protein
MVKVGLNGIVLILVLAIALAVSGCSGSDTGGTATPTPQPGGGYITGTPEAAPTAAPTSTPAPVVSEPTIVGQLYSINDFDTFTYRMTSEMNGQKQTGPVTISFSDTTYNGVEARHLYLNMDAPATAETGPGQILVDVYMRKSDNSTLGGHTKWVVNGQTFIDMDIPADEASDYTEKDLISSGLTDRTPLTSVGAEPVTIDGKTYSCTKYTYVDDGITKTVWFTPQAPMPVKMQWTEKGSFNTMELLSWS